MGQTTLGKAAEEARGSILLPLRLDVAAGEMEAYLNFNSPEISPVLAAKVEAVHLRDFLVAHGVRRGVLPQVALECVEKIRRMESFAGAIVARGASPEDGRDSEFVPVEKFVRSGPLLTEEGTIDYKEHPTILPVTKGEVLGSRRPPQPGRAGFTVTGKWLPAAPGRDIAPVAGSNVEVEKAQDGTLTFRAAASGAYRQDDRHVLVSELTVVEGDVNFSTGNIRCNGSLEIRGGVAAGFKVEVEGNLDIHEAVEAAEIVAGGDVRLRRGVKGQGKGKIKCGGCLSALYVERATIEAGGDVEVDGALLDCRVTSGGMVRALRGRGRIVGGEIRASRGVEARQLGSDVAGMTTVDVGFEYGQERNLKAIAEELADVDAMLSKIERAVAPEILQQANFGSLPEERKGQAQALVARWYQLRELRKDLTWRKENAVGGASRDREARPVVRVLDQLSARVRVRFPTSTINTDRDYHNVFLVEDATKKEVRLIQK
ncbi:MAG: DUF342 domain-containing protein [Nitrospirae bacterium]|nr:DUF342 domain-containing protein [Nitrospirota bacterium]